MSIESSKVDQSGYVLHHVGFVFQHSRLVAIHVEVVGSAEDGHHRGETGRLGLAVHSVSIPAVASQPIFDCDD